MNQRSVAPNCPESEGTVERERDTAWKFLMKGPPSDVKSVPWSEKAPKPRNTCLPPCGTKSLLEKYVPTGSGCVGSQSKSAIASAVRLSVMPNETLAISCGR